MAGLVSGQLRRQSFRIFSNLGQSNGCGPLHAAVKAVGSTTTKANPQKIIVSKLKERVKDIFCGRRCVLLVDERVRSWLMGECRTTVCAVFLFLWHEKREQGVVKKKYSFAPVSMACARWTFQFFSRSVMRMSSVRGSLSHTGTAGIKTRFHFSRFLNLAISEMRFFRKI